MRPDNRMRLYDLAARLFVYVVLGAIAFGLITQSVIIGVLMFALFYAAPMMIGYLWLKHDDQRSKQQHAEIEARIAEYYAQKASMNHD